MRTFRRTRASRAFIPLRLGPVPAKEGSLNFTSLRRMWPARLARQIGRKARRLDPRLLSTRQICGPEPSSIAECTLAPAPVNIQKRPFSRGARSPQGLLHIARLHSQIGAHSFGLQRGGAGRKERRKARNHVGVRVKHSETKHGID